LKKVKLLPFLIICLVFAFTAKAQNPNNTFPVLSDSSSISLLTCGSGNDLYSIFGHTAIRVKDPKNNLDVVFNYGTFQFTDDFLFLFAMGKLNYTLSVGSYEGFERGYQFENRWVDEQVLNLDQQEVKEVFEFLTTNYLPENREYLYDFFYDDCCTRSRDVFETVLGEKLVYNFPTYETDTNFHDMLDVYLQNMQWVDFGMDLGLGKTADRILSERDKMFLPDYVLRTYDQTNILHNGNLEPFVTTKRRVVESIPVPQPFDFLQPLMVFWGLFVLYLLLFFIPFTKKWLKILDLILYFSAGLCGILILFLWFVTDHTTTQVNFNILWTLPLYLFTAFTVFIKNKRIWLKRFYLLAAVLNGLLLISWVFLPQDMNEMFIPVILLLLWRNLEHAGVFGTSRQLNPQV